MLRSARSFGAPIGAILLLLVVLPGTASADLGEVDCDPQDPFCDILAGDDDEDDDGDSGGNGSDEDDGSTPGAGEGGEADCTTQPGQPLPEECIPDPQMTPIADLAEQARDRLNLPQPEMASSPADHQLVHLPTWLAVSESSWGSVSASVTAGAVTVTATAAPSRVEWDLGDGSVVVCEGPGTIWRPGMDPEAESPDCGHIYTRSASEVEVTATVYWTVNWTSTIGTGGSFDDLATASQAMWEVAEGRSVIVR